MKNALKSIRLGDLPADCVESFPASSRRHGGLKGVAFFDDPLY